MTAEAPAAATRATLPTWSASERPMAKMIGRPMRRFLAAGLVLGKILGIVGAVVLVVRMGWGRLPAGSSFGQVVGVAAVAGIGSTVSLFISGLAFEDDSVVSDAKIGILGASLMAALIGSAILLMVRPHRDGSPQ